MFRNTLRQVFYWVFNWISSIKLIINQSIYWLLESECEFIFLKSIVFVAGSLLGSRDYASNPEYFEYLRKTDPVTYAIWYENYMRKLQDNVAHNAFAQSDRASIHSGQSSGNRLHVSSTSVTYYYFYKLF